MPATTGKDQGYGVVAMLGQHPLTDNAFLPSTVNANYALSLKVLAIPKGLCLHHTVAHTIKISELKRSCCPGPVKAAFGQMKFDKIDISGITKTWH